MCRLFRGCCTPGHGRTGCRGRSGARSQGLLPVKDRALLRRDLHDIVPDAGPGDGSCNAPAGLLVKFRPSGRHLFKSTFRDLGDQVVGRDKLSRTGAHRAFGKRDKLEVHDLRGFLSEEFHGALELRPISLWSAPSTSMTRSKFALFQVWNARSRAA